MTMAKAKRRKPKRNTARHGSNPLPKSAVSLVVAPWDTGASGAANRVGMIVEDVGDVDPETGEVINPNKIRRVRRLSVAAMYLRAGHLTDRQAAAADVLLKAWEQKDRRPPAINEAKVDASPKADDRTVMVLERAMRYVAVARLVAQSWEPYVMHVARDDRHISSMPGYRKGGPYMDRLRKGLDDLADRLGRLW